VISKKAIQVNDTRAIQFKGVTVSKVIMLLET